MKIREPAALKLFVLKSGRMSAKMIVRMGGTQNEERGTAVRTQ